MADITPIQVQKLATETANLPDVTVIGIFGSADDLRALIRTANGGFARVGVGDKAMGGIVASIAQDKVIITRRGRNKVLAMVRG